MGSKQAVQQADAVQVGVALLQAGKQRPDGIAYCQHKLHHLPPAAHDMHSFCKTRITDLTQPLQGACACRDMS